MEKVLLEMNHIVKTFPGVRALNDVNLKVKEGEIHALVGENGAGKSTLMSVLSGIYPHGTYEGDILFDGKVCSFKDIKDSEKLGIVIIHQELALVPYLSIAENMFLGNEQHHHGIMEWDRTNTCANEYLKRVGLNENPATAIRHIGVGKQQLVEIAKALAKDVRLLILDEPTAALNDEDSENLLKLLLELKKDGVTAIIISHKLNEIEQIADSITIIRDGSVIETIENAAGNITEDRIIKGMVGRDLVDRFPKRMPQIGEVALEIRNWNVFDPNDDDKQVIHNASLTLRRGEVVGLVGLMGAGRTELAMSVFGKSFGRKITGTLIKDGKEINLNSPDKAIENGLAYVTEDRKSAGLILIDDIKRNISLASLGKISNRGIIDENREIHVAEEYKKKLNIKCSGILQKTGNLSGGNQQKVILSRWIYTDPDVLILDEPTRGIDVGAKYEIYNIINKLADDGKSILMISSEMPEILGMCDRVYVMYEGRIVGELGSEAASQESIMKCIMQASREA